MCLGGQVKSTIHARETSPAKSFLGDCTPWNMSLIVIPMNRYLDIKDSCEFQRYTRSCHTHKEAGDGMEEVGKEVNEKEMKEEEVEEEKRQQGRVSEDQIQILKCISNISCRWQ